MIVINLCLLESNNNNNNNKCQDLINKRKSTSSNLRSKTNLGNSYVSSVKSNNNITVPYVVNIVIVNK